MVNQKTVAKWKEARSGEGSADGAEGCPFDWVLGIEEEAIIVAFRKHTLLPLEGLSVIFCAGP